MVRSNSDTPSFAVLESNTVTAVLPLSFGMLDEEIELEPQPIVAPKSAAISTVRKAGI
jgi:hypothetical protein